MLGRHQVSTACFRTQWKRWITHKWDCDGQASNPRHLHTIYASFSWFMVCLVNYQNDLKHKQVHKQFEILSTHCVGWQHTSYLPGVLAFNFCRSHIGLALFSNDELLCLSYRWSGWSRWSRCCRCRQEARLTGKRPRPGNTAALWRKLPIGPNQVAAASWGTSRVSLRVCCFHWIICAFILYVGEVKWCIVCVV